MKDAKAVPFPSYIGNTYDATHMIALAIKKAGGTEGPKVQSALENLGGLYRLDQELQQPVFGRPARGARAGGLFHDGVEGSRLELIA